MDASPLAQAHAFVKQADRAAGQGDFAAAHDLHVKAGDEFLRAQHGSIDDLEAKRTLSLLQQEHVRLANDYLARSKGAVAQNKDGRRLPSASQRVSASTLQASVTASSNPVIWTANPKDDKVQGNEVPRGRQRHDSEAFNGFMASLPAKGSKAVAFASHPMDETKMTEESFYVVPPEREKSHSSSDSNKALEQLAMENKQLRRALDSLSKLQSKDEMGALQTELAQLKLESSRLQMANTKYRERWEKLKEGAKRRRPS